MTDRRDKLGRRIPQFDRSAAGKKASKTTKEKYGPDHHKRIGIIGARLGTRGYFGKLKAEGKTEELHELAIQGAKKANQIKAAKRNQPSKSQTTLRRTKAETPKDSRSTGVSKR